MAKQPIAALRVADLATSVAFYTERLGFALGEHHPEADRAECFYPLNPDGNAFLLAGPRAEDVMPYLSGPRIVLEPGETIRFLREDLETVSYIYDKAASSWSPAPTRTGASLSGVAYEERRVADRFQPLT